MGSVVKYNYLFSSSKQFFDGCRRSVCGWALPMRQFIERSLMIDLVNINKSFRTAKRSGGLGQAVKALFSREYTTVHALNDVSFHIDEGETVGYIGPNGAGKSSTVKVMSGILTPDSGECRIDGLIPWKDRKQHVRNIGVVFGQRSQLWWDVPVIDSFELLRDIYAIPQSRYRENLATLTQMLQIEDIIKTPTRSLSLGQRMRCEIAASLLHDPKILFLDEPTIGLDAVSKIAVRDFIRQLNREKKTTVILTTHDMQDIEALAERILLIGKGRILLDGTLSDLKQRYAVRKKIVCTYSGGEIAGGDGMSVLSDRAGRAEIAVDTTLLSVPNAVTRLAAKADISDLSIQSVTAEEIALSLYKEFHI